MNWIDMVLDRDRRQTLVDGVMDIGVP